MKLASTICLLALALAVPACATAADATDANELEGEETTGVQRIALTETPADACTPKLSGAAITYQSTTPFGTPAWKYPAGVTIELTTLSPKPFKMVGNRFSVMPAGVYNRSGSSSCEVDARTGKYRCVALVTADVNLCTGSGDYQIKLAAIADADSGCGNGEVPVNFRLTTENLCSVTTVGGGVLPGHELAVFRDGSYAGTSQELGEGLHDTAALTVGNDAISSLKVAPGWKVTLFEHAGFSGASQTFTGEVPFVGALWNDRASSLLVQRQ